MHASLPGTRLSLGIGVSKTLSAGLVRISGVGDDASISAVRAFPPSVLFDAVAVILSDEGAKALSIESAAIDFVRDAFGHLKAIAVDHGGRALLTTANVGQDAGVVPAGDSSAFIAAAKTRQWVREKSVRTLA